MPVYRGMDLDSILASACITCLRTLRCEPNYTLCSVAPQWNPKYRYFWIINVHVSKIIIVVHS